MRKNLYLSAENLALRFKILHALLEGMILRLRLVKALSQYDGLRRLFERH